MAAGIKAAALVGATALALAGCARQSEAPSVNVAGADNVNAANAPATAQTPLAISAADPKLQWGPCPPGMPAGCQIAVLHGDPAKPNADVLLRVPGGAAIAPHTHTSAERIVLVGGRLEVQYKGAPAATLNAGDYGYGPAGLPHRADCRSSEPCTLFIAFEQPVDRLAYEGQI